MVVYKSVTQDPSEPGCFVLADSMAVRPLVPLLDPRMPTLWLVWALEKDNWEPIDGFVQHTAVVPADGGKRTFDKREAARMKVYYQVLTQLERCLPLAGGIIPSQHLVAFYKCLLAGLPVAPNSTAKFYTLTFNRERIKKPGAKTALIPLEDDRAQPIDDNEHFAPLVGAPEPKRRAGSHSQGIRGRGSGAGRGRGHGRGGDAAPPPPVEGPPGPGGPPGPQPPNPLPISGPGAGDAEEEFFAPPPVPVVAPHVPRDALNRYAWTDALEDCTVSYQAPVNRAGEQKPNYVMKCPYHENCYKSRGCGDAFERNFRGD